MESNYLSQIEKSLKRLNDQLDCERNAWITAERAEKVRIRQRIEDLSKDKKEVEKEYLIELRKLLQTSPILNSSADEVVVLMLEEVETIHSTNSQHYAEKIIDELQEIKKILNSDNRTPIGKLKLAIPIFLNIITYEAEIEIDTNNLFRGSDSLFQRLLPSLEKLKKK